MQIEDLLRPKILIVSGKGGVGKTTVSAALALVAARSGRKVCIAEVDRKGTLPKLFGGSELSYEPRQVAPGVWGMNIIPDLALAEYLEVQYRMKRISRAFTNSHFVDYITTAAPGLKDILVLGKIWYLEQNRQDTKGEKNFDTIIVDAPAAGHMLTFLSAPMGLSDALRVGPVRRQSDWLVQMLRDPKRSRVHLVTLAEEMPVSETLETSQALHDKLGIDTGAVLANAILHKLLTPKEKATLQKVMEDEDPSELKEAAAEVGLRLDADDLNALVGYERFLEARRAIQAKHLKELRKGVPEPVMELPYLFSAGLELPDVETLADVVEKQIESL
jgi:anion-transporting  ArsA/GET3 family ATPase